MYEQARVWRSNNLRDEDGIIVGIDQSQEWLLPWWWDHYRKHNRHSVAFIDFGMTVGKKDWCRERGELVPLFVADIFVKEREEIEPEILAHWEASYGKQFWPCRNAWFKKPLACLQSPFKRTIWVDLDCEIRGSLQPLFDCVNPHGIALFKEKARSVYNSGVIVFKHGLSLIEGWADQSFEKNHLFRGDQELLSHLIEEKNLEVSELPEQYNWSRMHDNDANAVIVHWHGEFGHSILRHLTSASTKT
jgi:hypothetical protein